MCVAGANLKSVRVYGPKSLSTHYGPTGREIAENRAKMSRIAALES